jgi:hypothetical protein
LSCVLRCSTLRMRACELPCCWRSCAASWLRELICASIRRWIKNVSCATHRRARVMTNVRANTVLINHIAQARKLGE